jgi:uroporphyrinogen decarboxylase
LTVLTKKAVERDAATATGTGKIGNLQFSGHVPVDYKRNAGLDARLKKHFALAADDDVGLCRALGVDFRGVTRLITKHYKGPLRFKPLPGRQIDEWGIRRCWVEHGSGGYWDYCDFPLAEVEADDLLDWPIPDADDYDVEGVLEECQAQADFCLYTGHAGVADLINSTGMLSGMEQTLIDLMEEEPSFLVFLDQRIVDLAKSFNLPVMIHSCGSNSWAFDDFIEMGINAIDTLQPEATRMEPRYLKERWGNKLAFHGCISTAGPVATAGPEETVANAKAILEIMMPGGGYMFAPTHALQDDSPTANVVELYRAAAEIGRY